MDPAGYVRPDHPVQHLVTAVLADLTGADLGVANRAVDGCSIPTYAIPLESLALAFARFATGEGMAPQRAAAAARLREACAAEPFMVAGTGRFCTEVMTLFPRRVLVKTGAEGVYCAAFPELGLGVALECDDGATRAAETLMAAVIDALVPMSDAERDTLAGRVVRPVMSRAGAKVGETRPVPDLKAMLR